MPVREVWPSVQEVVRQNRPDLYEDYRKVLFDSAFRRQYRKELGSRIRRAARDTGMAGQMC